MNSPIVILNKEKIENNNDKTYVVLGSYFSGTSLVTGLLRRFGIYMGRSFNCSGNQEDLDFQLKSEAEVSDMILQRNKEHQTWGWKDPNTINFVENLLDVLRNPVFIILYRDDLAIAQHMMKDFQMTERGAIQWANGISVRKNAFVIRYGKNFPMMLISFEKARENKEQFISSLAINLGIDLNEEEILEHSEWMGEKCYKQI